MITIDQMVAREVNCCLSSLVSTLACGYGTTEHGKQMASLVGLCEQAYDLSSGIPDYEEAALEAGWEDYTDAYGAPCWRDKNDGKTWAGTAEDLCGEFAIEPYDREVFEHWSVSTWLAEKLEAQGEKVDTDFAGMCVWARTTTGQGIASDGCIQRIHADMVR